MRRSSSRDSGQGSGFQSLGGFLITVLTGAREAGKRPAFNTIVVFIFSFMTARKRGSLLLLQ